MKAKITIASRLQSMIEPYLMRRASIDNTPQKSESAFIFGAISLISDAVRLKTDLPDEAQQVRPELVDNTDRQRLNTETAFQPESPSHWNDSNFINTSK